jgi:hypothetical protein
MQTRVINMVRPSRRVVLPQLPQPSQPPLQTNTSMNKYSMKQDWNLGGRINIART